MDIKKVFSELVFSVLVSRDCSFSLLPNTNLLNTSSYSNTPCCSFLEIIPEYHSVTYYTILLLNNNNFYK